MKPPLKTDQELVQAALSEIEKFSAIVERYERRLYYYIRRISAVSEMEAEETLQEVFLKIWKNLNGYDENLSFQSWVYRITHNHVISHYRKYKHETETTDAWDEKIAETLPAKIDTEAEIDAKFSAEKVRKILTKMSVKHREIIVLRFFEDLSYDEISDILKKPVGTIGTLLNRAKKEFQSFITELPTA